MVGGSAVSASGGIEESGWGGGGAGASKVESLLSAIVASEHASLTATLK